MKQEKRKVALRLMIIAVCFGLILFVRAAGSQETNVSFGADVDAAMADIENVLTGTNAPTAPSEAVGVASEEAITPTNDQAVVSVLGEEIPAEPVMPAQDAVVMDQVVAEGSAVQEEPESVDSVVVADVPVEKEVVGESTVSATGEVDPASAEEMVSSTPSGIVNEPVEPPAEAPIVQQAKEEFSGFEPLKEVAEEPPVEPVVDEEVVTPDAAESDAVSLAIQTQAVPSNRITVQLDKAGLEETINLFSQLSGVNIIIPKLEKEGTVTVNLNDVEWKPALQSVLDAYGLELFQKVPSVEIYTIREKPADATEPLELKTFRLKYATVDEVEVLVKSLLTEGGSVSKFPSRNMISVRTTAPALEEIGRLISEVDIPREQVFIEAKFLELNDNAQRDLGIDWQVLEGYGVGASSLTAGYGKTTTKATGSPSTGTAAVPTSYTPPFGSPAGLWMDGPADQEVLSKVTTSVLNADDFRMVLSALQQSEGVSVVSNPKIIVANEETASINIGQKKPNVKGTTTTSGQYQTITTYALDDTEPYFTDGIKVNVTPTVNTENNISVRIEPTLDRLDATPVEAADGTLFYGKTTKSINTVFSLQSGQTAAIGGLTEVTDSDVERKVPVLGSIPFIGRLFRYNSKYKDQTETIIFVTIGLANPESMSFETGLPEDAELVRRRIILEQYHQPVRALERDLYDAGQRDEQERTLKQLEQTRSAMEKTRAKKEAKAAEKALKVEPVTTEEAQPAVESAGTEDVLPAVESATTEGAKPVVAAGVPEVKVEATEPVAE